jgi:hypothetical protein
MIKNNKAEIWLNNKVTVMHCSIPTLNTALVFTWVDDTRRFNAISNLERRASLLGIKHNSFAQTGRIIYKAKKTARPMQF